MLLLDEPTAGLDPEERTRVRMLASLAGERTVVLATRDPADVPSSCRRCALQAATVASAVRLPDRTGCRVISPAPPLPSARPLRPGLEDGYLALIRRQARAAARALPD